MNPISRRELIKRLKTLGFTGPYSSGRHLFKARYVEVKSTKSSRGNISTPLLKEILRQAGFSEDEWNNTK